jgi:hypothetical protein
VIKLISDSYDTYESSEKNKQPYQEDEKIQNESPDGTLGITTNYGIDDNVGSINRTKIMSHDNKSSIDAVLAQVSFLRDFLEKMSKFPISLVELEELTKKCAPEQCHENHSMSNDDLLNDTNLMDVLDIFRDKTPTEVINLICTAKVTTTVFLLCSCARIPNLRAEILDLSDLSAVKNYVNICFVWLCEAFEELSVTEFNRKNSLEICGKFLDDFIQFYGKVVDMIGFWKDYEKMNKN